MRLYFQTVNQFISQISMRMEILYQFNEKYVPYAGVSITSLLINHQDVEDIRIWILGEELQDASVEKLRNLANEYHRKMVFLETTELINKMKSMNKLMNLQHKLVKL